jgi:hypothetical protein
MPSRHRPLGFRYHRHPAIIGPQSRRITPSERIFRPSQRRER